MDEQIISAFRNKINSYYTVSEDSFRELITAAAVISLTKDEILLREGYTCNYIYFLNTGYLIAFIEDETGHRYNKNIFTPLDLVSSTVSAILHQPSAFTLQAVTACTLLRIPYQFYRDLIFKKADLQKFYLHYLERNWIIEKEAREISLVMEDAETRYNKLLQAKPGIEKHVPLQHIASHLGITPTQLSRIRKSRK
ncbi:MAG: Crp/Fnr family transcriptional regulator [Filimonas sp.]|nr:Crp/Fnr family transcriptional regulator [Filimonas sp.]